AVPLPRKLPLRDARPIPQPVLAGPAVLWRGVAQQPPRLPDVRLPWSAPARDRHRGLGDRGPRAAQARPRGQARASRDPGRQRRAGSLLRLELVGLELFVVFFFELLCTAVAA